MDVHQYGSVDDHRSSASAKAVSYRTLLELLTIRCFSEAWVHVTVSESQVFINKLIGCHKNLQLWLLSS